MWKEEIIIPQRKLTGSEEQLRVWCLLRWIYGKRLAHEEMENAEALEVCCFFLREAAQHLSCSMPVLATVFWKPLLPKTLNQIFLCAAFQYFLPTTERIPLLPGGVMHRFDCWALNMLHSGGGEPKTTTYCIPWADQTFCERKWRLLTHN